MFIHGARGLTYFYKKYFVIVKLSEKIFAVINLLSLRSTPTILYLLGYAEAGIQQIFSPLPVISMSDSAKGKESIKLSSAALPAGDFGADSLALAARSTHALPQDEHTVVSVCALPWKQKSITPTAIREMIWLGRLAVNAATVHY